MVKALLVGGDDRLLLASCRSLGGIGIRTDVLPLRRGGIVGVSRHCSGVLDFGDAFSDVHSFVRRLSLHLRDGDYKALIPLGDAACVLCDRNRELLEALVPVGIASRRANALVFDNQAFLEHCQQLGIPTIETTLIRHYDDLGAYEGQEALFPCWLRPVRGASVVDNTLCTFPSSKVSSFSDLEQVVRDAIDSVSFQVSKPYEGYGVSVHFLASEGHVLSMVQQEHLHELSDPGSSSYQQAVAVNSNLATWTRQLVESIGWTGAAVLDFCYDPAQSSYHATGFSATMSVSLALTLAAGLDFPLWQYKLLQQQPIETNSLSEGVRSRHLGNDIQWLRHQAKTGKQRFRTSMDWMASLRHVFSGAEALEVESWRDPLPALAYWTRPFIRGIDRTTALAQRFRVRSSYRGGETERLDLLHQKLTLGRPRLLFVCRGNVCRSAFAECYARHHYNYPHVTSAGTLPRPRRRVPQWAETVAMSSFGIDISGHRSRCVDTELVAWADVILVADRLCYFDVVTRFPGHPLVLCLGSITGRGNIEDPWGKSQRVLENTFGQIIEALDSILAPQAVPSPQ